MTQTTKQYEYRYWNRRMIIIGFLIVSSLAGMNYVIDPYQIFHANVLKPSSTSNERFNKMEYLLHNKKAHNAFLLGSSRMGVFNPQWFSVPGLSYYNLSVFSGDAKDMMQMLKLLKKKGTHIKQVIVGIDLFPFIEKQRYRPSSLQHHPLVKDISYFLYYMRQLFNSSLYQSAMKIQQHFGQRTFTFNYATGQWSLAALDQRRNQNKLKYQQQYFKPSSLPPMHVQFQAQRFVELNHLKKWLEQNNIKAKYFIHPFSQVHQKRFTKNTFIELRKRVKGILPKIQDFSNTTQWTNNTDNYHDPKHYRVSLAKRITARLK